MAAGNFMIEINSPTYQSFALFWSKAEAQAAFARFWAPDDGVLRLWQGRFWENRQLITADRGRILLKEIYPEDRPENYEEELEY